MRININGKAADVTLENEKTVGEVTQSVEKWLEASGHRLSGISIDGQAAGAALIDDFLSRKVEDVKTLDLYTSSLLELTAESLVSLLSDVKEFESLSHRERETFFSSWKESAQANFISERTPDLYDAFINAFSRGGISLDSLFSITEERLRELNDPLNEFSRIRPMVEETSERLTCLALDIQTGKDARAAGTIQLFSGVSEKILRVLPFLEERRCINSASSAERPYAKSVMEFGSLIKELLDAYAKHDSVLVGDIAEYEAAVKLRELYETIIKNSRPPAKEGDKK